MCVIWQILFRTLLTDQLIELVPNPADGYSYNGAFIDGTYYTAKELECSQEA